MESLWTIDALCVGVIKEVPAGVIRFGDHSGSQVDVPLIMYVLRNGQETVLVDTGGPLDPEVVREHHGFNYECPRQMHPAERLKELGVDGDSVTAIIHTHLHWDHCGNDFIAPNATIFVQLKELQYAIHPCPANRSTYEVLPLLSPAWLTDLHRIEGVDGEKEIIPGLTLVPLPGHSPGSQGVVVNSHTGKFVITGDCVDNFENWGDGSVGTARPSGGYTNLIDFYHSLKVLTESGWRVLPSHDISVTEPGQFGYASNE